MKTSISPELFLWSAHNRSSFMLLKCFHNFDDTALSSIINFVYIVVCGMELYSYNRSRYCDFISLYLNNLYKYFISSEDRHDMVHIGVNMVYLHMGHRILMESIMILSNNIRCRRVDITFINWDITRQGSSHICRRTDNCLGKLII